MLVVADTRNCSVMQGAVNAATTSFGSVFTYRGFLDMNLQMSALPVPVLDPEDIAAGVLYLAPSLSRYVTGTILDIALGTKAHTRLSHKRAPA